MADEKLLSMAEAAERLGVSQDRLAGMVSSGEIDAVNEGGTMRFRESDVQSRLNDSDELTLQEEPELVLDDEDDLSLEPETDESQDVGVGTEEIVFEDEEDASRGQTGTSTEEIPVADTEAPTITSEEIEVAEADHDGIELEDEEAVESAYRRRPNKKARRVLKRPGEEDLEDDDLPPGMAYYPQDGGNIGAMWILVAATVLLVLAVPVSLAFAELRGSLNVSVGEAALDGTGLNDPGSTTAYIPGHLQPVVESLQPEAYFGLKEIDTTMSMEQFRQSQKAPAAAPAAPAPSESAETESAPAAQPAEEPAAPAADDEWQ